MKLARLIALLFFSVAPTLTIASTVSYQSNYEHVCSYENTQSIHFGLPDSKPKGSNLQEL